VAQNRKTGKIETTNTGGKVLAYDGEELVGRLEFSFPVFHVNSR
jgi:hypothetical protein